MRVIILCLMWLIFKHWLVDFVLQTPYQFMNKGKYGHPGGLLHSGLMVIFSIPVALVLGIWWILILEFFIHYHMDWAKVKLNERYDLKPDSSEKYWWLLGFDQMIHYLTYIIMVI
ncbi:DUF3307 domain-containing protein [Candidatus Pacearchaeota archaeon]|nr:DUF3307 domain-containing protein [Candidatus Pacearchaeota archaeon]